MNRRQREKRFIIITFPETRGSPSIWSDTTRKTTTTFSVVTSIKEMRFWGRHATTHRGYATIQHTAGRHDTSAYNVYSIPIFSLLMMMMMMKVREGSRASADVDEMTDKELSLPVSFGNRRRNVGVWSLPLWKDRLKRMGCLVQCFRLLRWSITICIHFFKCAPQYFRVCAICELLGIRFLVNLMDVRRKPIHFC